MSAPLSLRTYIPKTIIPWLFISAWALTSMMLGTLIGFWVSKSVAVAHMLTYPQPPLQAWGQVGPAAWAISGVVAALVIFATGIALVVFITWAINLTTNRLGSAIFNPSWNNDHDL